MPNRTQSGYMPNYQHSGDIKRNLARTAEVAERARPKTPEPSAIGRPDLVDAGDFDRPYEQWSMGDLQNRARQLDMKGGLDLMTKDRLIEVIRAAESKPMEQWTKTELYNRARDLDIYGRSALTKRRLVNAIRKAEAAG